MKEKLETNDFTFAKNAKRRRGIGCFNERCFGEITPNPLSVTNFSLFTSHFSREGKRVAFTLAETLITLGIIGVVAALTLPSVIEHHQKKTAETRLRKFYSNMSQAILMWQTNEGITPDESTFPADTFRNGDKTIEWYNGNLGKYMPAVSSQSLGSEFSLGFKDGSGTTGYIADANQAFFFFCVEYKHCGVEKYDGKNSFLFELYKGKLYASTKTYINMSREELLYTCKHGIFKDKSSKNSRHACTRLIEYDGWQIKDDYPWRYIKPEN